MVRDLLVGDLHYHDSNVHVLKNATATEVMDVFSDSLLPVVTANDVFVFYYSGHGTRTDDTFKFCTKGPYLSHSRFLEDGIRKLETKRCVIIVDACHSGQFDAAKDKGTKDKPKGAFDAKDLEAFLATSGRLVMVASQANQLAPSPSWRPARQRYLRGRIRRWR